MGLGVGAFTIGLVIIKVASSKVTQHEKACSDNQDVFIPIIFDTFDFLAPEAVDLLHRVQRVIYNNDIPRSMNVVLTMIDFVIQKSIETLLVGLLPICILLMRD